MKDFTRPCIVLLSIVKNRNKIVLTAQTAVHDVEAKGSIIMQKQNLHTHTIFDHGADTVEEMIETAIEKGFTTLGFSGHGTNRPLAPTSMSSENQLAYKQTIREAKEKYKGQIEIFMGIEQDSMAPLMMKSWITKLAVFTTCVKMDG